MAKLTTHIEVVHQGKKKFICYFCKTFYSTQGNLNVHLKSIHEEKEKSFDCSACDSTFNNKSKKVMKRV